MKKGISPIVAVVLLIAIAVIAAVGLYFWVGSLTNKPATPSMLNGITVQVIDCGGSTPTLLVTNIGTKTISDLNTTLKTTNNSIKVSNCQPNSINPGDTAKCEITKFSGTIVVYGNNLTPAPITC